MFFLLSLHSGSSSNGRSLYQWIAGTVTPHTRSLIACIPIIIFHGVPIPGMGIHPQSRICNCAVTGETDISVTVTRAAGQQVAARLTGMISRPLMGRKQSARMTGLALRWIEIGVIRTYGT